MASRLSAAVALLTLCLLARGAVSDSWTDYLTQLNSVTANGQALSRSLGRVLSAHNYSTPLDQVLGSQVYGGDNYRLRRVISAALDGTAVNVLVIGGNSTAGIGASTSANSWTNQVAQYINAAFGAPSFNIIGTGVSDSGLAGLCTQSQTTASADLVLVELTANDGPTLDDDVFDPIQPRGMEVLLRNLLQATKQPAVALVQLPVVGMAVDQLPYQATPEGAQYGALAQYYDVPTVSARNALWTAVPRTEYFTADGVDLNDAGHALVADTVVNLLQQTAVDVAIFPPGASDLQGLQQRLPTPMYPEVAQDPTDEAKRATCEWLGDDGVTGICPDATSKLCGLDTTNYTTVQTSFVRIFGADPSGYLIAGARVNSTSNTNGSPIPWLSKALFPVFIIGIIIAALLLLACCSIFFCIAKRRRSEQVFDDAWKEHQARQKASLLPTAATVAAGPAGLPMRQVGNGTFSGTPAVVATTGTALPAQINTRAAYTDAGTGAPLVGGTPTATGYSPSGFSKDPALPGSELALQHNLQPIRTRPAGGSDGGVANPNGAPNAITRQPSLRQHYPHSYAPGYPPLPQGGRGPRLL